MKYIKQLDGLRFVAILLVLVAHFASFIGNRFLAGYVGVTLFFVISGFLITRILIQSQGSFATAYTRFLGRRALRIFPIYYLTIFVLYAVRYSYIRKYLFYCLTYTYNYAWVYFDIPDNAITHFWSLGVEEQFYLVWPTLVLLLRKKFLLLKGLMIALMAACALQLAFKIIPAVTPYNYTGIFPQAYALLMGGLGAVLFVEGKIPAALMKRKDIEYFAFCTILLMLITHYKINDILWPVFFLFLILKTACQGFQIRLVDRFLRNDSIVYLGTISYGIYIYHLPLEHYFTNYIFNPFLWNRIPFQSLGPLRKLEWHSWIIKFPLYSFLSIGLAGLSFRYIEQPILKLKEKYFRS